MGTNYRIDDNVTQVNEQVNDFDPKKAKLQGSTKDGSESRSAREDTECVAENIADNGGIQAAYQAFQALQHSSKNICVPGLPFTANQLFWVG